MKRLDDVAKLKINTGVMYELFRRAGVSSISMTPWEKLSDIEREAIDNVYSANQAKVRDLAKRLGIEVEYTEDRHSPESIEALYQEVCQLFQWMPDWLALPVEKRALFIEQSESVRQVLADVDKLEKVFH